MDNKQAARAPPALNPEQVALVQPWKDWLSRGLVTKINLVMTPTGLTCHVNLAEHVPIPKESKHEGLPPGLAREYVNNSGLAKKANKVGGVEQVQPLPARSLDVRDIEKPETLEKRIVEVARKLTSTTAIGRIASRKMNIEGCTTFEQWWSKAASSWKARLVMDENKITALSEEHKKVLYGKIGAMNSPFRGPLSSNALGNQTRSEKKADQGGNHGANTHRSTPAGSRSASVAPIHRAATPVDQDRKTGEADKTHGQAAATVATTVTHQVQTNNGAAAPQATKPGGKASAKKNH